MGNGLAVSALDLVGMRAGEAAGGAIARSVDLAQHVEKFANLPPQVVTPQNYA
jgi:hypothetical protein